MAISATRKVSIWIIMILLFIGLMGFGATGLTGNVRTLGSVGDKPIPVQTYARQLTEQIRAIEAQTGQPLTFQQAQQIGIDQAVLGQIVAARALDNEAARLGISVGDSHVAEEVLQVPQFQGLDGRFDREAYAFALRQSGLTEAQFETGLREEMARTLLQSAVIAGIPAPQTYAEALSAYIGEQRSFAWVELTPEDLAQTPQEPAAEELHAYYEAHPDAFTRPETRALTYAWITPQMIEDEVEVDETALRDLYEERIGEFLRPEHRLVERLIFSNEEAARAAIAAIAAGETDFETLVAERGLDLADIDLGDVAQENLGAAGEAVFAARPGEVVGPFPTALGPALFRMNAVLAAQEIAFEEALPELRQELAAARARRVIEEARGQLSDLLAGGASIEDLAEQTDMELGTIELTAQTQDGIAAYTAFREAAMAAEPGAFPELFSLEDGGLFALRLDALREPVLRPYEEVQEAVLTRWRAERIQEALLAQAQDLAARVQVTHGFTGTMPQPNLEEGLTRRSFVAGTPPGFMAQVFAMEPGEARAIETEDGAIVVYLDAVTAASPDDPSVVAERESLAQQTMGGISQDIFEIFTRAVQQNTAISINEAAVNAVHATFQ